jgi:hypothetical protein
MVKIMDSAWYEKNFLDVSEDFLGEEEGSIYHRCQSPEAFRDSWVSKLRCAEKLHSDRISCRRNMSDVEVAK